MKRFPGATFILAVLAFFGGEVFAQTDLAQLAAQINRGNNEQKRNALFEIRNIKTAEASRLAVSAIKENDEIVRATAARSVIYLPSDEAFRVLLPLLKDKKPFVRKETAYALGLTRNPAAISFLAEIIQKDKIQEVRDAAVVALGEIGEASAVAILIRILQTQPKEKEEFTRRAAARSIGHIAHIIQTGNYEILNPQSLSDAKYKTVKVLKHPNLIEIYPAFHPAISVLSNVLQSSREFDDVKREAAFALGIIGDVSALNVLQSKLGAQDYYLAKICEESIQMINANLPQNSLTNP